MKKIIGIFVITLFGFCFSQLLFAAESENPDKQKKETEKKMVGPWRNFELDVGAALTSLNSNVRFGTTTLGLGLDVNVEDALGIDSSTLTWFAAGFYRFGSTRRHRFDFSYTSYNRDATNVLPTDIPIFDVIFPEGATVYTKFNFDIIRAGYSYSLLKDDRMDIGLGGGLYVMPIDFEMNSSSTGVKSESITAPLPVLTLRGDFALTKKLFLKGTANFFWLKINDVEGSILTSNLAIEYNFWKNVGFGFGINNFVVEIDSESNSNYPNINFSGQIDFQYRGLLLYTKIMF